MNQPSPSDDTGLRVLVVAALVLLVTIGSGCGANHTGEIIGIDPAPEQAGAATAPTATASATALAAP